MVFDLLIKYYSTVVQLHPSKLISLFFVFVFFVGDLCLLFVCVCVCFWFFGFFGGVFLGGGVFFFLIFFSFLFCLVCLLVLLFDF